MFDRKRKTLWRHLFAETPLMSYHFLDERIARAKICCDVGMKRVGCHSLPCSIRCEVLDMLFEDGTTWIKIFFIWVHLLLELVPTMWIDFEVSGRQFLGAISAAAFLKAILFGCCYLILSWMFLICFWFVYCAWPAAADADGWVLTCCCDRWVVKWTVVYCRVGMCGRSVLQCRYVCAWCTVV